MGIQIQKSREKIKTLKKKIVNVCGVNVSLMFIFVERAL